MHVLGLSHSHFQGFDGYLDDCFDAGAHMIIEGMRHPNSACFVACKTEQIAAVSATLLRSGDICQS